MITFVAMETHNFHLYIGSEAKMKIQVTSEEVITRECKFFTSVDPSWHKDRTLVGFSNGKYDDPDFFDIELVTLVLRPLSSMTGKELAEYRSLYEPHNGGGGHDPWWENDIKEFQRVSKEMLWCIKKGFDVGLIPEGKFILEK